MNNDQTNHNSDNVRPLREMEWLSYMAQQRGWDELAEQISDEAVASQNRLSEIETRQRDFAKVGRAEDDDDQANVLEMPISDQPTAWQFTLFVSARRNQAFAHLKEALSDRAPSEYSIRVVNVLRNPGAAEREGVLFTPTVIARYGTARLEFVGDISSTADVRRQLALQEQISNNPQSQF